MNSGLQGGELAYERVYEQRLPAVRGVLSVGRRAYVSLFVRTSRWAERSRLHQGASKQRREMVGEKKGRDWTSPL